MKTYLGILAVGVGMSLGIGTIAHAQQPQYQAPMPQMGQRMGQAGGMMDPQMQAQMSQMMSNPQMQAQMSQMRQGCERMMAIMPDRMHQPNRR